MAGSVNKVILIGNLGADPFLVPTADPLRDGAGNALTFE